MLRVRSADLFVFASIAFASIAPRDRSRAMLRTIEKYEILEEIGHGGMATVFRARDTKLDRLVALKVMHPHLRGSKEARARFRREAQGVARLKHPRVLEIYDYSGEDSEESYIATELLTGPTLRKLAEDHPGMPAEVAACIGIEVCQALSAAHEKGIVHRDVKPENILVHRAPDGPCVKLTDFGIADMVDSQTMTATGQILGSPGHMSPEQIEGKDCDARSDVFSLGTVLYFLACGKLPFTGRNPHQVLKRIVEGEYPDPLRVQPAIGGRMRAILLRALARDREQRYASAAELERELRAFVAESGVASPAELVSRYVSEPARASEEMLEAALTAELALARRARDAGDVAQAMDRLARVLALRDGHPEALALVGSIGRTSRRRSLLGAAAAVAGLLATAIVAWVALGPGAPAPPLPRVARGPDPRPDAGQPEVPRSPDAGPVVRAERDAGAAALARTDEPRAPDAGRAPVVEAITPLRPVRRPDPDELVVGGGAPRHVVFRIDPVRSRIGVDGALPRDYGPSFTGVDLVPGPHRFLVESACCETARFERVIPPGPGDFVLEHRLESQPALLIVRTGTVPADVSVGNGLARGRSNDPIRVPISSPDRRGSFEFTVTAPGRRAYTGRVQLAAGTTTEEPITLEAAEPAPE
jgi:serine/threonine-protein kinase